MQNRSWNGLASRMMSAFTQSDPNNLAALSVSIELASACYPSADDAVPLQRQPRVSPRYIAAYADEFLRGQRALEDLFLAVWGVGVTEYFDSNPIAESPSQQRSPTPAELEAATLKWGNLIDPPPSPEGVNLAGLFGAILRRKLIEIGVDHPALKDPETFLPVPGREFRLAAWLAKRVLIDAANDSQTEAIYEEVAIRILRVRFGVTEEAAENALEIAHFVSELPDMLPKFTWLILSGVPEAAPSLPEAEVAHATGVALEYCLAYALKFGKG